MKKGLIIPITLLLIACGNSNETENNDHTIENGETVAHQIETKQAAHPNAQCELTVEGMTCEIGCVRTVRSHLSKMNGVTSNEISFNTERVQDFVSVQYDSNLVSMADIKEEIESIAQGIYDVTKIESATLDEALSTE